ncbi:hypothetical protein KSS87_000715, partial [Heliosperma pusillum]
MGESTGTARVTWQPQTTGDTSTSSYWLNWRVLLCAILVLISMGFASFLISKFEGPRNARSNNSNNNNRKDENDGVLYADEVWKPCLEGIHPGWLLAFRVCAFFVLLILLIVNAIVDGGSIFYYYTQWTFTLVTIYFGLGSVISMYGCYEYHSKASGERVHIERMDSERGDYIASVYGGTPNVTKNTWSSSRQLVDYSRPDAGFWGYILQIIYQMNAGAVMLTDMVAVSILGLVFVVCPVMLGNAKIETKADYSRLGEKIRSEIMDTLMRIPNDTVTEIIGPLTKQMRLVLDDMAKKRKNKHMVADESSPIHHGDHTVSEPHVDLCSITVGDRASLRPVSGGPNPRSCLSELFIFDDDVVDDEDLISWIMSLGEPSTFTIQMMKDRGNSLFKKGSISLARSLYNHALNFLCFVGMLPSCDKNGSFSLAVSLVLNVAACDLKLTHYDRACRFCKFVLHFEPSNVKALYRRGFAYKRLNLLQDALTDFEAVLHLDPNNSEARRELLAVVDGLVVNPNGKRIASPFDLSDSLNKGKKPLFSDVEADNSLAESSCSTPYITDPMTIDKVSNVASLLSDTFCKAELAEGVDSTAHVVGEKKANYVFSNKKQDKNKLHISADDYEILLTGKDFSFYNAAEVPPSSPLAKEQVECSVTTLVKDMVVQMIADLQSTKKKRVSSDSAQVSAVQFQFVAIQESKSTSCRRK